MRKHCDTLMISEKTKGIFIAPAKLPLRKDTPLTTAELLFEEAVKYRAAITRNNIITKKLKELRQRRAMGSVNTSLVNRHEPVTAAQELFYEFLEDIGESAPESVS